MNYSDRCFIRLVFVAFVAFAVGMQVGFKIGDQKHWVKIEEGR